MIPARSTVRSAALTLILVNAVCAQGADNSSDENLNEWPMYRGNASGTGYSALDQITAENVDNLEVAWSYSLRNDSTDNARNPNSQVTPIVVDGVMYFPTLDRVVAIDPLSGAELWSHSVPLNSPSRRGVSYWPGQGGISPRIFYTAFDQLVALDAETGEIDREFGESGMVGLGIPYISVPFVYELSLIHI